MTDTPFNNQYLRLGAAFAEPTPPVPVRAPGMIRFNTALATELGLADTELAAADSAAIYAGNRIPAGAEPAAMAYSGHQFGHFNPQLGDGRALLLGQVELADGTLRDIHMKGTGQTRFSRNGDGRAALGPVLREYLVSEAMAALGVPTTRALAAVTTGEEVARQQLLPGGVITRTATSFVRVGTFEHFAARGDIAALRQLADYVIAHNYPACHDAANPYEALLQAVIERQAALIAQWMQLGFIHGVMNTDNMSIAGETIDYGPCAFMDHYAHEQVYSSIDHQGRYAYNNQPSIGLWNLTRLAETLVPLMANDTEAGVEMAKAALQGYAGHYAACWLDGMRRKTGLATAAADDRALIEALLDTMAANRADFTLTFQRLGQLGDTPGDADAEVRALFEDPAAFDGWAEQWRARLQQEDSDCVIRQAGMQAVNPAYIPRNHQVEAAIRAAEDHDDFTVFHDLHAVLQRPFDPQPDKADYSLPPEPHEVVQQTFCGT